MSSRKKGVKGGVEKKEGRKEGAGMAAPALFSEVPLPLFSDSLIEVAPVCPSCFFLSRENVALPRRSQHCKTYTV